MVNFEVIVMSMKNRVSKKRQVMNHLSRGWGIDATTARKRYGVRNLRATISDIREMVEEYGNWEITSDQGRYTMRDTHPGKRTYAFRKDGTRYRLSN
jgi:hypothetical protein